MSHIVYVIKLVFSVATLFAAGDGILGLIDRGRSVYHPLERLGLSYLLGVGALAFTQLYLMAARVPLTGSVAGFVVAAWWCLFLAGKARPRTRTNEKEKTSGILQGSKAFGLTEAALGLYIGWLCFMMFFACLALSRYSWDSRAVWAFIAKIIYHNGTVLTPDYLDPLRYHPAPFYPILMPLTENIFYHVIGGVDEYGVKVIYAFFYAAYVILFYNALRTHYSCSLRGSLAGTAIAASIPAFFLVDSGSVPSAYVDFPLGCFFMAAMLYLFQYLRLRREQDAMISALCGAFCLFTKNEGIALFLIACAVLCLDIILSGRWRERKTVRAAVFYCVLPVVLVLPWFIMRGMIPPRVEYSSVWLRSLVNFSAQAHLVPKIIGLTFKHIYTENSSWGLVWSLITVSFFLFPRRLADVSLKRICAYLIAVPLGYYFCVIMPVYMSLSLSHITLPVEFEFQGASFERLQMHALPLLLLYLALTVDRALARGKDRAT